MKTLRYSFLILGLCVPVIAHHGTGTYDFTKSVTLTGSVTEFAFTNPHAALYFDAKDANGNATRDEPQRERPRGCAGAAGCN